MTVARTILVMAGAREAHGLVAGLRARHRPVIACLPEPERMFAALPVPTRVGVFEDAGALAEWMRANRVATVIDASHAFDAESSRFAVAACRGLGLDYLRLLRPPWRPDTGDSWHEAPTVADAARAVPTTARVFSNTGRASLPDYAGFTGAQLFLRQNHPEPRDAPYPFLRYIEGVPPYAQSFEEDLFGRLGITHLICRNVGGTASISKLLAARRLSLPVHMVARPLQPEGLPSVETVAEALAWEAAA